MLGQSNLTAMAWLARTKETDDEATFAEISKVHNFLVPANIKSLWEDIYAEGGDDAESSIPERISLHLSI